MRHLTALALALSALLAAACTHAWSDDEQAAMLDLRLQDAPGALPPDPTNRYADDPRAAALGEQLFFDARLSNDGTIACATCHVPELDFQDGTALARGVGTTTRRTMPLAGVAASTWFFWDGRKDSLWSQALGPLESDVEHGTDRAQVAHVVVAHHRDAYEAIFGALPSLDDVPEHAGPSGSFAAWEAWTALPAAQQDQVNRVFANVGKAIAAYERTLARRPARFDGYVDAVQRGDGAAAARLFSDDEAAGLRLFLGKAQCTRCHNGPLLTNQDFANTGVPARIDLPEDTGRLGGARAVLQDEFNCTGPYSDAAPADCRELNALHADAHTLRQYKVPSLRNVAARPPYMHAGQLGSLADVIDHYDRAPAAPRGETELEPLALSAGERAQLVAFLHTLSTPN